MNNAQFLSGINLMPTSVQSILDVFVIQGLISVNDADNLKQKYRTNREVEQYLINNRVVSKDTINKAYSILLKLPYISLENVKIPSEIINIIPRNLARKYGVIAFAKREDSLLIAVSRPSELSIAFTAGLEKLMTEKHLRVDLYITGQKDFEVSFQQYSSNRSKNVLLEKGSLPAVFLRNQDIAISYLGKLPIDFIENFRCVIFDQRQDKSYAIALERPDDPAVRSAIEKISKSNNVKFQIFATSKEDINYALDLYQKKISLIDQKKQDQVFKKIEKPVAVERPDRESLNARRDEEVVTFSNLFSSFLGGSKKDSSPTRKPVVTVNSTQEDSSATSKAEETKQSSPANASNQGDNQNQPEQKNSIKTPPKEDKKQKNPQPAEQPDADQETQVISSDEEIKDEDIVDGSKMGKLLSEEITTDKQLKDILKESYIPKIVAALVNYALNLRASDIHVDPGAKNMRIRFRIDGILQDIAVLPLKLHPPIVSRIKILSKMKIDETRIPQDGRFDLGFKDREVDVRVSCLPTVHGEKVVMRILDKSQDILSLEDLGMMGRAFDLTIESVGKPYGIILSTGPTGSGKSTTLYAIINRISSPSVNIITLEDPVEYEIAGVNQCQVKPQIGFTFADGLRSVLRQDPNVVMVGEIRDGETAGMATHAALTGHLVLSTLHTNDSAGALPRLINMGIEPFLITSSINLVIAQRLVRRICPDCKAESKVPESLITEIKEEIAKIPKNNPKDLARINKPLKFYHGTGCSKCSKGYKGRVGIFEVIRMTDKIEELAVGHHPASDIKAAAITDGMITMKQDGILKAMDGLTTLDEVFQATTS